jgi:cytochrome P450
MKGSPAPLEELLDLRTLSGAPYAVYRRLRDEAPVMWSDSQNAWLVSRYDDVKDVLESPERFSSAGREKRSETSDAVWEAFAGFTGFFWSDPPEYTLDREAWSRAFKPRLKGIPALVQGIVDELLDGVENGSVVDVVSVLAFPLPATVVFALLGVPREDRDMFRRVSAVLIGGTEEIVDAIEESAAWLRLFLEERQREPGDDMLSDLTAQMPPIDTLSDRELRVHIVNIVQFLLAGHETTTSTIASGLFRLLLHSDDRRLFLGERSARPPAVEEMLRFESPLQFVERRASGPTTLGDAAVQADETVKLLLGSANHDERVFRDPDAFDVRRSPNPHLAFGYGIHLCLGAPLARIEIPIAIESMLRRFPDARLACDPDEVDWRQNFMFHAIEELPIATSG